MIFPRKMLPWVAELAFFGVILMVQWSLKDTLCDSLQEEHPLWWKREKEREREKVVQLGGGRRQQQQQSKKRRTVRRKVVGWRVRNCLHTVMGVGTPARNATTPVHAIGFWSVRDGWDRISPGRNTRLRTGLLSARRYSGTRWWRLCRKFTREYCTFTL